ncbi:MAG: MBL fold metallo-hydrolase [Candidatus Omnitrophica bacterium]|nr:MBL fold metallo-hydrolase [Candidatus Omnitrophota bacterium]
MIKRIIIFILVFLVTALAYAQDITITMIYNNVSYDKDLTTARGVSCLIEGFGKTILFDTGSDGSILLANMERLNIDPHKIEIVVLSHIHADHTGGLWDILKGNTKLKVYACPNFSKGFINKVKSCSNPLIEVDKFTPLEKAADFNPVRKENLSNGIREQSSLTGFTQIAEDIYTTGEIPGRYAFSYLPEQALALKALNGLIILTGCAHPGIIKIVENVKQNISGDIYLVLGGFHLIGKRKGTVKAIIDNFKKLGIKKVAPTHCTGNKAISLFKEEYRDDFIEVKVGQTIEV